MKTKIFFFIFLMVFMTITIHCNPDPIRPPQELDPLFHELQGQYQSDDGYTRLTLTTNRYSLYLGDSERGGMYRINDFSHIEISLIDGSVSFEIERDPNGQIIGLTEVFNGDPVLHRMGQEEPFISYDNLDMEVIRQNLGGRYSGTINGQHMILELNNVNNTYYMDRGGEGYFGNYDTELTTYGILLVLYLENESEEYYLHSIENSIERITSRTIGIQEGLHSDAPPIEAPPTNSNDFDNSNGTQFYGVYSSQNRSFSHIRNVPTSFDYCRELLATLFGRYESNRMNPTSMIEITPSVMYMIIDGERTGINYTVEFRSRNGMDISTIRVELGEHTYQFGLVIRTDNTTIIGLMSNTIYLEKK